MKVGSLFSGAGGFDLGFVAAGYELCWQVENDRWCTTVLERHWPDVLRFGDIRTTKGVDLAAVDVVIFGSPCQDLSVAGRREGLAGEKSGLFFEAVRVIKEMRDDGRGPAWAVWENVEHALYCSDGNDFAVLIDTLAESGAVELEWRVLDAQQFGLPTRRRRVFLVAGYAPRTDPGLAVFPLPKPSKKSSEASEEEGEAATAVFGAGFSRTSSPGGRGLRDDLDRMTYIPTETGVRRLTPRECERLLGWPDDHTRWGADGAELSDPRRYQMVGNGVAAPVAEWVAERVLLAEARR